MEKEKKFYIKKLIIYSAITGVIGAVLSLIPKLMPFVSLFLLPFFGCIPPLIILMTLDKYNSKTNSTWAIMGATSSGIVCFCFLTVFIPLVFIIHLIFKNYYDYGIQYLNFFLTIMLFVMIEITYVATGAVIGLATGAIHNYIEGK